MRGDVLGQAFAYAAAGWPVFPCKPGRKVPDTEHGFLDATTSPAEISAWWAQRPRDNVAIATGAPGPDVLDVDVKPDGDGFAAFNRLRRAGLLTGARALVRTRSGGLHVYYAGTAQPSGRLVRHFLDLKAAGGYVIAPPSFVDADETGPAGAYELLDHRPGTGRLDWRAVRRLLDPSSAAPVGPPRGASGTAALVAFVAGLPKGNRNSGLFWAACRMTEAGNAAELGRLVAASTLPEAEARRTVESAAREAAQ
jgi:hypothetical protein